MRFLKSSLSKNVIYLFIVQGSNYLLPLLTFPYLVRVLGVETFGIFSFTQATFLYLTLIIDYGFNLTATQEVAKNSQDKSKISELFWGVSCSKILLFLIAITIIFFLTSFIEEYKQYSNVLWCFVPALIGNVIYPVWLFQGKEEMKWLTITSIASRVMILPLTFIIVHDSTDVAIAALIQSSANLIAGMIAIIILVKKKWIGKCQLKSKLIISNLRNGWHVFISTSAITLYTTGVVVVLGFISGPVAVGYFNAANTLRNAIQGLINPITQALYPRVSATITSDRKAGIILIKRSMNILSLTTAIMSIFLFFAAPILIEISAGSGYEHSILILRILSPIPLLVALSNVYGIQVMLTHGYKKEFSRILLSVGLISFIVVFPMSYLFSEKGAAITLLLAEILVTFMMFIFVNKNKLLLP